MMCIIMSTDVHEPVELTNMNSSDERDFCFSGWRVLLWLILV